MKNARTLVLIGNIILTLEVIFIIIANVLNLTTWVLGANFGTKSALNIVALIVSIIIAVVGWKAMNKLEDKAWRTFLIIAAIFLLISAWGNLLVSILFIIGFVLANKAAK